VPNTHDSERAIRRMPQCHADRPDCCSWMPAPAVRGSRSRPSAAASPTPYSTWGNRTDVQTWRISPYLRHRFGGVADCGGCACARQRRCRRAPRRSAAALDHRLASVNLFSGTVRSSNTLGWYLRTVHQDLTEPLGGASTSCENATATCATAIQPPHWTADRQRGLRQATNTRPERPQCRPELVPPASSGRRPPHQLEAPVSGTAIFGKTGSLAGTFTAAAHRLESTTATRSRPPVRNSCCHRDRHRGHARQPVQRTIPDPVLRQQAVQAYMPLPACRPAWPTTSTT
jgi:hypothetical protein